MGCAGSKEEKKTKPMGTENLVPKNSTSSSTSQNGSNLPQTQVQQASSDTPVQVRRRLVEKTSDGKVEEKYEIGRELGRGTFSIVKEGIQRSTGKRFALKTIDKKFVDNEDLVLLSREIDIMKNVTHRNVLCLQEIYETDLQLCLVMELVTGGELFYKIIDRGSYNEKDAAEVVRQLVSGVKYLHEMGICHRDLKPENLLTDEEGLTIKIADFGLSKIFKHGAPLKTSCGTPEYAAPEVLTGTEEYDKSVDLWSVGVITYVLLCGYPPFYGKEQPMLFEKIINARYDFPEPEWSNISINAKDFIKNLLVLNPKKRLTAEQALIHPFLSGDAGEQELNMESMREYNKERKKIREEQKFED